MGNRFVMIKIHVNSEINPLQAVVLHTPGPELEQMTPDSAEELLYDDILNLNAAREQHMQLSGVLNKVATVLQVKDLLVDILQKEESKQSLIRSLCTNLQEPELIGELLDIRPETLADQLILGTPLKRNTLDHFLSKRFFALPPLPNLFFTRDSAMVINDRVFIGNMASRIRAAEAIIMSHIFRYHHNLLCEDFLVDATQDSIPSVTFEGGDILILRRDTVLIGMSERTSSQGIDYLIDEFKRGGNVKHIIVVLLPKKRATIHLDMIFTRIDHDKAVVYPPLILDKEGVDAVHVNITHPEHPKIRRVSYLLDALKEVDIKLEPVFCGGSVLLHQKREQWQAGANFFTIAPGRIIGYGINTHTFEELAQAGIPRVEAEEVLNGKIDLQTMEKYAVAMSGNELTRGGGGCRCMTMPILRDG